jgi:hypothetical protein
MIIDTENYDAQQLSMFFDELSKQLKTKQQYFETNTISRKGVDARLKSIYSPQTYKLCGITLIEDAVVQKVEVEKLVLIKPIKYF